MSKGVLYGVGVGPGDPELMTLKAKRLIEETEVIAVPGDSADDSMAYRIAVKVVPDIVEKLIMALGKPVKRDRDSLAERHKGNSAVIEDCLDKGMNVVFLTIGDPNLYSTFGYIRESVMEDGYEVETVSGVSSVCAAASRLETPLAEWDESVHIIPANHIDEVDMTAPGTYVLMKPRGEIEKLKEKLKDDPRSFSAVVNCGMEDELVCNSLEEIPDDAGYFTVIIAK